MAVGEKDAAMGQYMMMMIRVCGLGIVRVVVRHMTWKAMRHLDQWKFGMKLG